MTIEGTVCYAGDQRLVFRQTPRPAKKNSVEWLLASRETEQHRTRARRTIAADARTLIAQAASLAHPGKKLAIEQFELVGSEVNLTGWAAAEWVDGPHVAFGLTSDNTQIQALVRLVSTHVAAPVRNWLIEHVPLGAIRHGEFKADFTQANLIAMRYEQPPPTRRFTPRPSSSMWPCWICSPACRLCAICRRICMQTGRTLTLSKPRRA